MPTQNTMALPSGDVEISFTGLCLLVPRSTNGEVDVFLVADAQHVSRIYVRKPVGVTPCDFGFGASADFKGELDLTYLAPPRKATATLPTEIADITSCTGQKLDPNTDQKLAPNGAFRARVKLPPGQFSAFSYGYWNYFATANGPLAYCANWLIKSCNQVDKLKADLETLVGSSLPFVQCNGVYRLLVVNIPPSEMVGSAPYAVTINNGDYAMHFDMFGMLLTQNPALQLPQWVGPQKTVTSSQVCLGEEPHKIGLSGGASKIGSFIRCMVAQAST